MIPAAFEYARAGSVQEAAELLGRFGEDAKILAGGHSLIPLMRLRLAQPAALVDINPVSELDYIVAEIASEVGDNQVRNLGTIGGVMAHADSAGDYPTLALMLDAEIVTNKRRFAARDFFQDLFTTPLEPDEIVCEVVFPVANGPHKYIKFRRRLFDWAIVGAAAQRVNGGWRVGLTNCASTPWRCAAVE